MTQRKFAITTLLLPTLLTVALAACQKPADDANIAIDNGMNRAMTDLEALPPSEEAGAPVEFNTGSDVADTPAPAPATGNAAIPAQYLGRWGMVAADCTSTRGDNKGLITIAAKTIRFYESTATLREQRPTIATSFSGQYDVTGEGQTWQRVMTFTRTGTTLKRADDEGSFTYTRCA